MAVERISKRLIDRLRRAGEPAVVFDTDLKGFGVRLLVSGAASYVIEYRPNGGGRDVAKKRMALGRVGELTPEEAREIARDRLAEVRKGVDPLVLRSAKRSELSVAQLCDLYLEEGCDTKKPSTLVTDRSRIARHIKPLLGNKLISDVKPADIGRFLRDVSTGKTAIDEKTKKQGRSIVRGGKGAATRTVRLLGGIFSFAVGRELVAANPCAGVKLHADGKNERFLTAEELQRLGVALREAETSGLPWRQDPTADGKRRPQDGGREVMSLHVTAAFRLLLFTGCRLREILNLKWRDVDLINGILNIADSKTGAKKVILAAPGLRVLDALPRSGEYVIAGAVKNRPRSDLKRPWSQLIRHAGLEGVRIHDLRHSFASIGAMSGLGLGVVGKLLGHASPATTARYSHFADDPVRRAGERIAADIAASLDGGPSAEVVPLKKTGR